MATLDRVIQLQQAGLNEEGVINQLRQEGVSPREIETALSQSRIKEAMSHQIPEEEMQQSIMANEQEGYQQSYSQQPQQGYSPQPNMPSSEPPQTYDNYTNSTQSYYDGEYYGAGGTSAETISEIAEQIVNERFDNYHKKTGDIVAYQNETKDRISDIDHRLKRIEESIEQLQRDIIKRIGEFGDSNSLVHRDLENLHNTMSKMVNPLMDNYKELRKINETNSPEVTKTTTVRTIKKVPKEI